jgi:phospholipid/cholesterol/gamma-HCH transport system permease protein|uniref:Putative ABC transport system permease protein n=1 Tax=Chlorobium chlorochromatii (strain CaD3) TaxID=340177 RepID=Q3ATC2_CHLCH
MPLSFARTSINKLSAQAKEFFFTMQEFFLFSLRAFMAIPKMGRYWRDVFDQATICGTDSIPIVLVSSISIGALLAVEVGNLLEDFGAKTMLGRSTALSVIRELGPLLMGLMLSARFGSRNGAELGAMQISEQIDALRAFGTDPVAKLVMPRLVAALVMFLPLTALSDFAGLQSAAYMAEHYHHIDAGIFWNAVYPRLVLKDFVLGFLKAPVFAVIITLVSSFNGFNARGGTAGVGRATIKGIVVSSGLVLIANFYVSKLVLENM